MDFMDALRQGIEETAKHLPILIVTGDAAQILLRPDEEAIEDKQRMNDDATLRNDVTRTFETHPPASYKTPIATPPLPRPEAHVFQYFLDGSVHGRSLGIALESTRSFHVACYQVGAAVVGRAADGVLSTVMRRHKALVAIPCGAEGISDTLWGIIANRSQVHPLFQFVPVNPQSHNKSGGRAESDDMRLNSNSVATTEMHYMEVALCEAIQPRLSESCRAIIDGSVKFGRFVRSPFVIGVAKSFWTKPTLSYDRGKRKERLNLVAMLASLPVAYRTTVFEASRGEVGFWYVRLRSAKDNPLEGVVKVEIPRVTTQAFVDSDEANWLSSALVAERTVGTIGLDKRGPSLLYPIHYAETIIKRGFIAEPLMDRIVKAAFKIRVQSQQGENA